MVYSYKIKNLLEYSPKSNCFVGGDAGGQGGSTGDSGVGPGQGAGSGGSVGGIGAEADAEGTGFGGGGVSSPGGHGGGPGGSSGGTGGVQFPRTGTPEYNALYEQAFNDYPELRYTPGDIGAIQAKMREIMNKNLSQAAYGNTSGSGQQEQSQTPAEPTQEQKNAAYIQDYLKNQVQNPQLPEGTEFQYTQMQANPDEFIDPTLAGQGITVNYDPTGTVAISYTISDPQMAEILGIQPAAYAAAEADGVTGTVDERQLLTYQLKELYKDFEEGTPAWASGAIRYADQIMLRRGLGASTMAGAAISQAVMEAATPIAQYNAEQYGQINLLNIRNKQEAMLSTQAAENAARQFNAQSENEINQFMSGLRNDIIKFNVQAKNAMEQFNAEQANSLKTFYSQLEAQQQQFVNQNSLKIAQANAEWRRAINLANTAGINAQNQINVQNRFNMSQDAVDKMWQSARDVFHWAQVTSENAKDRDLKLTFYNLQKSDYLENRDYNTQLAVGEAIGGVVTSVIDDIDFGSIFS